MTTLANLLLRYRVRMSVIQAVFPPEGPGALRHHPVYRGHRAPWGQEWRDLQD